MSQKVSKNIRTFHLIHNLEMCSCYARVSVGLLNVKIVDGRCTRFASYTMRSFGHPGERLRSFFSILKCVFHLINIVTNSDFSFQIHLWQLFKKEWKNTEGKQVHCKKWVQFTLILKSEMFHALHVLIFLSPRFLNFSPPRIWTLQGCSQHDWECT